MTQTVNKPAGWEGDDDDWYCVIEADIEKFSQVGKIWIPPYWDKPVYSEITEEIQLWEGEEDDLMEYIVVRTKMSNPEKALRFSYVSWWHQTELQMVIPTQMVNSEELGLWAICFPKSEELKRYSSEVVDWKSWGDIKGEAGDPPRIWPDPNYELPQVEGLD
jgi:hypothetical protein